MEFPVLIPFTSVKLHVVTEIAAITIAMLYYRKIRRVSGDSWSDPERTLVMIATIAGALIGSRLTGVLEEPVLFRENCTNLQYWLSSKSVAGGFAGGLFATEFYKAIRNIKRSSGDLYVNPILLGLFVGRIGCFSMGVAEHTYGTASALPIALNLGDGLLRHPLMLYELIFLAMLAIFLNHKRIQAGLYEGRKFQLFLSYYMIFRFFIEFLKPDPVIFLGLTTIQLTCLPVIFWYVYLEIIHLGKRTTTGSIHA